MRGCASRSTPATSSTAIADQVERRLGQLGDSVPVHEKARAEQLINDARQAIREQAPLERIRELTSELQQVRQGLGVARPRWRRRRAERPTPDRAHRQRTTTSSMPTSRSADSAVSARASLFLLRRDGAPKTTAAGVESSPPGRPGKRGR